MRSPVHGGDYSSRRNEKKTIQSAEIKIGYSVCRKSVDYSLHRKISEVFKPSKFPQNRNPPCLQTCFYLIRAALTISETRAVFGKLKIKRCKLFRFSLNDFFLTPPPPQHTHIFFSINSHTLLFLQTHFFDNFREITRGEEGSGESEYFPFHSSSSSFLPCKGGLNHWRGELTEKSRIYL